MFTPPNGLGRSLRRVPLVVVGSVYESRPNVTADAAARGRMSGNAVILRGGSEAVHSNRALHAAFAAGLVTAGVSAAAVQPVPTQERAAVGAMLRPLGLFSFIHHHGGKGTGRRVHADTQSGNDAWLARGSMYVYY